MAHLYARYRSSDAAVRRLLLGELLGLLAGAAGQACIAWWIAQRGGAQDLTRYGIAMALCSLLALTLLSPLGDRWPKQRLIRLARIGLLADALALALLAWSDVYRLPWLCACGALSALGGALLLPAQTSLLAELVDAGHLPDAIRLRRGVQALGSLLGPALGGAALALGGVAEAMTLNLLLFGAAMAAAWRLAGSTPPAPRAASVGWLRDASAGLRAKWGVALDRWWTLTGALMMVFLLPATGMLLPLRLQALELSPAWFGACGAALSLGLLAGVAGLADALIARLDRVRAIGAAIAACGIAIGAIGRCDWPPGLPALFALIGLGMSVTKLVGQTHRTLAVPPDFRARMAAGQLTIAHLAATCAPLAAAALLRNGDIATVYLWLAAGFLGSGMLLLAIPGLRAFLRLDHREALGAYERMYPQAFGRREGCGAHAFRHRAGDAASRPMRATQYLTPDR